MLTGMTARLVEVRHEPVVLVGLELSQPNYCAPAYLMPRFRPRSFKEFGNMLTFELFDLLSNLVQESGQRVRLIVADLVKQGIKMALAIQGLRDLRH
jgi:hypothetical protein